MLSVQCKMARAALGLGIRQLAELAKVAPATVARLEAGDELTPRTIGAIRAALEGAGVEFISDNGGGPGVRLKKPPGTLDAQIKRREHDLAGAAPSEGPPSPERGMADMRRGLAENELRALKHQRARRKAQENAEPPQHGKLLKKE